MIISKSPLRISLGGGGTDLPSYYRNHGGFVIAATIDKYVYVTLNRPFEQKFILKYSQGENAGSISEIKHDLIRESIKLINPGLERLEVQSLADIPSGTGLGSSGAFTTALVGALLQMSNKKVDKETLAKRACEVEIDVLGEPVGKQDQYSAAYGGLNAYSFNQDDSVEVRPLSLGVENTQVLEESLSLYFTGFTRSASKILESQNSLALKDESKTIKFLSSIKNIGRASEQALAQANIEELADLFSQHWKLKKSGLQGATNSSIDELYDFGMANGAMAGKVVGAGGGGFLLFISKDSERLRRSMSDRGLVETPFRFCATGTEVSTI